MFKLILHSFIDVFFSESVCKQ